MDARIARFVRYLTRFRRLQPLVGRIQARILRLAGGRIKRSVVFAGGQPVLVVTTTGRRSGKARSTTVAYLRHGEAYASAGVNLGSDRHPAWILNLRANPEARILVGGRELAVRAREAEGEEAAELWARFIERVPMVGHSRALAQRETPMVVWEPII